MEGRTAGKGQAEGNLPVEICCRALEWKNVRSVH